jgi:hypothetical protein
LKLLGLSIPAPEISPNEANPRGYFEPAWVVAFHKKLLAQADVRTLDARPQAWDLVEPLTRDAATRRELLDWLGGQLQCPQTVVKDPRTFWVQDLWREAAAELGATTSFLTMLRHPAEVAASRELHYLKAADAESKLARETGNVAGWTNVMLAQELHTRGHPRSFAHYSDLLTDWRKTMTRVGAELGLVYDADLSSTDHHAVDDFIDRSLHRAQLTWNDLDVPDALRDVASTVWDALNRLADRTDDAGAMADMDAARGEYARLFRHATALVQDQTLATVKAVRVQVRRRMAAGRRQQSPRSLPSRAARWVRTRVH